MVATRFSEFIRCARVLGRTPVEQAAILWHESKNVRARFHLARYHPERQYVLRTRLGPITLRDNFGDVTNLPGLLVDNEYRVGTLDADGVVFDVGANIGLFSLWILRHNPGRTVHAFEPLPGNVRMAQRNCPDAIVNQVAVGRGAGNVRLGVDDHGIMATAIGQRWATAPAEFAQVSLDEYSGRHGIDRVAFLKIDTEGMELDVLDGAASLLSRTARVAMETHGADRHAGAIARLTNAGFRIDAELRDGSTGAVFASRSTATDLAHSSGGR